MAAQGKKDLTWQEAFKPVLDRASERAGSVIALAEKLGRSRDAMYKLRDGIGGSLELFLQVCKEADVSDEVRDDLTYRLVVIKTTRTKNVAGRAFVRAIEGLLKHMDEAKAQELRRQVVRLYLEETAIDG